MKKRRSGSHPAAVAARRSADTAFKTQEAMGAAAAVIASRVGTAAFTLGAPTAESNAEMNLMVSEKVTAFSEAGTAVATGAAAMATRGARFAAEEATAAGSGALQLAQCRTPGELFTVQTRLMTDFWSRSLSYGLSLNTLVARTSSKALAPVHKAVTDNDRRLKKK